MDLKFDEKGLIPAIVQDHYTKEVLTLAYMYYGYVAGKNALKDI